AHEKSFRENPRRLLWESAGLANGGMRLPRRAPSVRRGIRRSKRPLFPHPLPQGGFHLAELGKRLLELLHQRQDLLVALAGRQRVAQGGGGVREVVGAFGELASGIEEVEVGDLART